MVAVALSPQVKEIPLSLAPPVSAEEHIANLKAAARGSPDGAAGQVGAVNGHNSDAYLPPREVARSIPCRFYPNCHYREKCIFYHPPPVNVDDEAALQHQQPVAGNGSVNGYPTSAKSPTNGYDAGQFLQQQQPGFYAGYDAQQQQNVEYMHYLAATQQQHGYLPPHLQHQQAAFYAYPGQQQQQTQQQSQQPNGYVQQPQYQAYYHPQQGMYASIPPSMYSQHIYPGMSPPSQSFEQPLSPSSPTSPAPVTGSDAPADPAIVSQSPRNSATHPSSSSDTPKSASSPTETDGKVNGSAHSDQAPHTNGASSTSPHLANPSAVNGAYYPVAAPIPMPLEALQAQFGNYSAPQQANGDVQAQLEADFARASLNGHSASAENGDSSTKNHERTQSAQMKTLYQTGNADPSTSNGSSAGNAEAQTFVPAAGTATAPAAAIPTNALSASTARLPIHTGPRMHEALNGSFHPGHRRDLSSSSALSSSKGSRPFGPSSSSASRATGVAPQRNGPPRPFDPNRPVSQCRYFSDGGCRFGDSCFFSHTLRKALPVPGATDGRTTFDAKALKANIGDPDGNLNTMKLRPPGKTPFATPANGANGSWNGAQRIQQQHSPNANNAPLASGAAQTNGSEQLHPKDSQTIAASTEEQLQKLISEMPRQLNGSSAAPAPVKPMPVPAVNGQSATAAPRSAIPPTLGHRPPTAPRHHHHHQQNGLHPHHPQQQQRGTSSQRIPSGENDFPALHNGATGFSTSRERSSSASGRSVADVVAAPAPAPAPAPVSANKAVEQKTPSSTEPAAEPEAESLTPAAPTAAPAAASSAPPAAEKARSKPAPTPAPAPAKAKAAAPVSWASRAAQAASLPDPPKSKARPAPAASAAQKSAKGEKKEKAQSTEAGKKDTNSKEADLPAGKSTVPEVATAAVTAVAA